MMKKLSRQRLNTLLSLTLFLCMAGVATWYRDELVETLATVHYGWLLLGLLCYLVNYLCRAWRIRSYSTRPLPIFPGIFRICCLHGFAAYFLPMRSGDLTLPILLKGYQGIPVSQGGRILFRARMLDLMSLGFLLTGATLFTAPRLAISWKLVFLGTGLGLAGLPWVLIRGSRVQSGWVKRLVARVRHDVGGEIPYPRGLESAQSLIIWFWTGCTTFCVIRALHIPLPFEHVWFFAAIQLPLQLLPVQGLANSGNHEAGWLLALDILGIRTSDPLSLTLASHVLLIGYVLCLGGLALLLPTASQGAEAAGSSD